MILHIFLVHGIFKENTGEYPLPLFQVNFCLTFKDM